MAACSSPNLPLPGDGTTRMHRTRPGAGRIGTGTGIGTRIGTVPIGTSSMARITPHGIRTPWTPHRRIHRCRHRGCTATSHSTAAPSARSSIAGCSTLHATGLSTLGREALYCAPSERAARTATAPATAPCRTSSTCTLRIFVAGVCASAPAETSIATTSTALHGLKECYEFFRVYCPHGKQARMPLLRVMPFEYWLRFALAGDLRRPRIHLHALCFGCSLAVTLNA